MSHEIEEFARVANAERRLCEEAGPAFVAMVRAIEAQAGLSIAEVRVTFDVLDRPDGSIGANCTIVRAHAVAAAKSNGHDIQPAVSLARTPSGMS